MSAASDRIIRAKEGLRMIDARALPDFAARHSKAMGRRWAQGCA